MRRPPVVLGMALLTCMALLVAVLLILFSVNPSVDRNEGEIRKAVMSQHAIICAQVQNTANAYRFRSLTPSGDVEPIRHFLTRMQAQQQTLRLARGSECRSAPGFPPVGLQVRRALRQIHEILQHFEPALREPIEQRLPSSHKQTGFSQGFTRPPNAGIGEEGIPAHFHEGVAPQGPEKGSGGPAKNHPAPAVPRPPQTEAPQDIPAQGVEAPSSPETTGEPGTKVEGGTERITLPLVEAPLPSVKVEVNLGE